MATNRDVPLTLSVETIGTEGVRQLQTEIKQLAKQGGDAAPEFERLASEVGKLGDQAKQVAGMRDLAQQVEVLAAAETTASNNASDMRAKLAELSTTTATFVTEERQLKDELIASQRALFDKRQELAVMKNSTTDYTVAARALNAEIIQGKTDVRNLADAYRQAKEDSTQAAAAEKKLAEELSFSSREATNAKVQLSARTQALHETKQALDATGLSATSVATAEASLLAAYRSSVTAVGELRTAQETATAAKKAAADAAEAAAAREIEAQKAVAAATKAAVATRIYEGNRMAQEYAQEVADAKAASDAISNALGTVGVRSTVQLQAEIGKVRAALELLKSSGTLTGAELDNAMGRGAGQIRVLERELRSATGQMTLADRAATLLGTSMGQFTAGNLVANGVMMIGQKVADLGREFIAAVIGGDKLSRALNAIYKDSGVAASQLDVLRKVGSAAGVAVGQLEMDFVKFSASMKSANIPLAQSNALFEAVTKASAGLGLSSEDTAGALNALGQMASKGTVSMEELRQQLGDRLPGAIGLSAKGLGITEAQLVKLVETGQLAARDFFPAFTEALKSMEGSTEGVNNSWGRLKTTLTTISQDAGASGWAKVLDLTLRVLGGTVGYVALGLSSIAEGVILAAKATAAAAASLTIGKQAFIEYGLEVDASRERLTKQAEMLNNFIDPQTTANAAVKAGTDALGEHVVVSKEATDIADKLASVSKLAALAAKLHANETTAAATSFTAFNAAAAEALIAQSATTDALNKQAKAAKIDGDELVKLAALTGDKSKMDEAAAQAATMHANALDKATKSQEAEVQILTMQLDELEKNRVTRHLTTEQIKSQKDSLDKKLISAHAELDQMQSSSAAAVAEASSRALVVKALKDHSGQIGQYNVAVLEATAKVVALRQAELDGKDVKVALKAAQKELAEATFLYNDAVKDAIAKTELDTKVKSAHLQVASAQASASASHYKVLADEARAIGDTATATYYDIRAKEESIKVLQLKLRLDKLQNDAALIEIELKRKLVTGTDEEKKVKLELLDIEKEMLKIKQIGNQAVQDTIRGIETEITALRNGTSARSAGTAAIGTDTSARQANTSIIGTQTSAIRAQSQALDELRSKTSLPGVNAKAPKAGDSSSNYDPGYGDSQYGGKKPVNGDGQTKEQYDRAQLLKGQNAVDNNLQFSIRDKLNAGTLGAGDVGDVQNVLAALKTNDKLNQFGRSVGGISLAGIEDDQKWKNMIPVLENFLTDQKNKGVSPEPKVNSSNHTVNINLGGSSTAINTATASDATALTSLLKQLGNAAGRTI
jgi:tape measure domain-containing protein